MTQIHKITIVVVDHYDMKMSEIKHDLEGQDAPLMGIHVIDSVPVDPWQMPHDVAFDDEHIKAILDRCRNPGAEKQPEGDEKCETCRFWWAHLNHPGGGGFCCWKPDSPAKGRSEWCGQYEERKTT